MSSRRRTQQRQNATKPRLYFLRIFQLVWSAAKGWAFAWLFLLVLQGLLPGAIVYLSRPLVNAIDNLRNTNPSWATVQPILPLAGLMAGLILLTEALQVLIGWIRTAQSELIQDYISGLIHEKSVAVDYAFYESPEYYDHLHRARSDAATRSVALLESSGSLLQNGITLAAMAALLLSYALWLPAVLLASTLPALYVVFRFNRIFHQWWERTTADRRWTQYYDVMLTQNLVAAELRLFGLGAHFRSAFQTLRRRLRRERLKLTQKQSVAQLSAGLLSLIISSGALAWIVWQVLKDSVNLGDLTLFYLAFSRAQNLMRALLGNLGQIYSNSLFLGNLFEFLELEPEVVSPEQPVAAPAALKVGVAFQGVTFRYPGSQHAALEDFSLTVPAGKIVAIVGENGAGKSTLVKLLCRFYDPQAGRVTLDGVDIRQLAVEELRRRITVLFQFPVSYHATAGQNIALGDLSASNDQNRIERAARAAGAHDIISRLPHGYDTLLGKGFASGTELSGGEWQRVALARAFLRQAPIIVLDEPTSFMDAWAEAEWLKRFRELAIGRTSIIITHRFTTAMQADIIHVMKSGVVVESGSHDALMAQNGLYAQSWLTQTRAANQ